MITSKYEVFKLLEERRELEGKLFKINHQLNELDVNPFEQKNHHYNGGLPIVGDFIVLMLDTLVRVVSWIVKKILP